jgi:hypothetical protein
MRMLASDTFFNNYRRGVWVPALSRDDVLRDWAWPKGRHGDQEERRIMAVWVLTDSFRHTSIVQAYE